MKRLVMDVEPHEAADRLRDVREILVEEARAGRPIYAPRAEWLERLARSARVEEVRAKSPLRLGKE